MKSGKKILQVNENDELYIICTKLCELEETLECHTGICFECYKSLNKYGYFGCEDAELLIQEIYNIRSIIYNSLYGIIK